MWTKNANLGNFSLVEWALWAFICSSPEFQQVEEIEENDIFW